MARSSWRNCLWLCLCLPALALAHLMPAGQGSVRLTADSAWLAVAVPVDALRGRDEGGAGRITLAQLGAQRDALLAQLRARVQLDVAGQPGRTLYEDLIFEAAEPGDSSTDQLLLLRRESWSAAPQTLRLRVDLSGPHHDGALLLRALRGAETDVALFGPGRREHTVFPGVAQRITDYAAVGLVNGIALAFCGGLLYLARRA